MTSYSKTYRKANREAFARDATFEAFGHRAHWALDDPDFKDRLPNDEPALAAEFLTRLELLGVAAE
jgi:hypothetical protein